MAQDEDGLIGIGNKLPWHLPEELALQKVFSELDGTINQELLKEIEKIRSNRRKVLNSK